MMRGSTDVRFLHLAENLPDIRGTYVQAVVVPVGQHSHEVRRGEIEMAARACGSRLTAIIHHVESVI